MARADYLALASLDSHVLLHDFPEGYGFSVRCIED